MRNTVYEMNEVNPRTGLTVVKSMRIDTTGKYMEHKTLMEKNDCHGWTEDKAWVVGNALAATVEFDNGEPMEFPSYDEAVDWLYERGYRI